MMEGTTAAGRHGVGRFSRGFDDRDDEQAAVTVLAAEGGVGGFMAGRRMRGDAKKAVEGAGNSLGVLKMEIPATVRSRSDGSSGGGEQ